MSKSLQIVETAFSDGDSNDTNQFILNEDNLTQILGKVPSGMEVAVVTVVGAFRTGKSFLLNFLLRFLTDGSRNDMTESWMTREGSQIPTNATGDGAAVSKDAENKKGCFSWRGGKDRHTTGIWMWSEPLIRANPDGNGDMAILLMDTQGMFDNETTMTLTAQIFGLSTMVSSFQIYNVDKLIQENNLQDLALFSEYGRSALEPTDKTGKHVLTGKPFQRLQFLVRDWQNFDAEIPEGASESEAEELYTEIRKEMDEYIAEVIKPRQASDLQSTRSQITRCFERVDCFLLPHPGMEVTKKTYDGSVEAVHHFFRSLLNRYVRELFDQDLEPKVIQGQRLTGMELMEYFKAYVEMFKSSNSAFPEATTILAATTKASIFNASKLALVKFEGAMDKALAAGYLKEQILADKTSAARDIAMAEFDSRATFGDPDTISASRKTLEADLAELQKKCERMNALKNPFRDAEKYIIPIAVALLSRLCASFINMGCDAEICVTMVSNLRALSFMVFIVFAVLFWSSLKGLVAHLQGAMPLITGALSAAATKAKAD